MKEIGVRLGAPVWMVRKWFWKLDIRPQSYDRREFKTKRGRRMALVGLYPKAVVDRIRKAMSKDAADQVRKARRGHG